MRAAWIRWAVCGFGIGIAALAGGAQARPPWGGYAPAAGARVYVAAPSSFTWNQFNAVTSATGNVSQVIGASGPVSVNQTSGPVIVFGGAGGGWSGVPQIGVSATAPQTGAAPQGGAAGAGLPTGGVVGVNTGATTVSPGPLTIAGPAGAGQAGASPGAGLGAGSQAGGGGGLSAGVTAGASAGGASAGGGAVGGGAGLNVGLGVSASPLSAGVNVGAGATAPVQVCTSCLTGGVGG